jgi:hypothetical protein
MWRQNRRQITPTCIGADLNRNFEITWRAATIQQPCGSLTFRKYFKKIISIFNFFQNSWPLSIL